MERANGSALHMAVTKIATKYHVSTRSVYRDWATRRQWIDAVLEIGDPKTFAAKLIASHEDVRRRAGRIYMSAKHDKDRVAALNLVRKVNVDLNEMVNVPYLIRKVEALEESR
jgi:hypothetical protein